MSDFEKLPLEMRVAMAVSIAETLSQTCVNNEEVRQGLVDMFKEIVKTTLPSRRFN